MVSGVCVWVVAWDHVGSPAFGVVIYWFFWFVVG